MYFTETDCATPEVASFSTGGWDEMLDHPAAAFSEVVAANFGTCILLETSFVASLEFHESSQASHFFLIIYILVTFYATYPVSDQPVKELNIMKEEQLPTYSPPPLEACVLPPTMPPTPEPTKSPTVRAVSSTGDAPTLNLPSPYGFQPSPNGPIPVDNQSPGSSSTGSSSSAILVSQQWAVLTIGGALVLVM